jgi:hypothetical protein
MPIMRSLIVLLSIFILIPTSQASIINGDFQTCDLTGFETDSDGLVPGFDTDFDVIEDVTTGNCVAQIQIDLFDQVTFDPVTQAFFANTLFTELDLTVDSGFGLNLAFDYNFFGEEAGVTTGRDSFLVALGDGSGDLFDANGQIGSVFEQSNYGSGTVRTDIDASLFNQTGFSLEFQLLAGEEINFLGSTLQIDNIILSTFELNDGQAVDVPVPATLMLLAASLLGLRRKIR